MHLLVIDPIAFEIGPLSVAWYGIIIVIGMVIAVHFSEKEAVRLGFPQDTIIDMAFWILPIGIIGARLYYVIFEWEYYIQNPIRIFFIWEGGLAIYGGIIAGILTLWYLSEQRYYPFILLLDILAPYTLIAQSIGRWGNFVNQEAHGGPVSRQFLENLFLPNWIIDQMKIEDTYYHPTFLYESIWNLVGGGVLILLSRQDKLLYRGEIAAGYMIWYGVGRFFIESMRTDSLYIGPFRVSQIVSLILVAIGIGVIIYQRFIRDDQPAYYSDGLIKGK